MTGGTFETFCDYRDQKPDISLYDPAIVEDLVDFRFFGILIWANMNVILVAILEQSQFVHFYDTKNRENLVKVEGVKDTLLTFLMKEVSSDCTMLMRMLTKGTNEAENFDVFSDIRTCMML